MEDLYRKWRADEITENTVRSESLKFRAPSQVAIIFATVNGQAAVFERHPHQPVNVPVKSSEEAPFQRNRVIHFLEEADIESDPELRRALLTFVVAGGGFSGVEAVAELNDFVRAGARNFRHINAAEIRVTLLHAGPLILPELPEDLARFAQNLLRSRGVEIRLNTRLAGATAESAILEGGDRIPTKTLVSTVPAAPNALVAVLSCRKERGRIVVNRFLEVLDHPGVWALGDCAWVVDQNTWQPCPPTAQHATRQAACLAKNLIASLRGEPESRPSHSRRAASSRPLAIALPSPTSSD